MSEPLWRHKVRGSTYREIGRGKLSSSAMPTFDMLPLVIYQNVETGEFWARQESEFKDGRFERLAASPSPAQEPVAKKQIYEFEEFMPGVEWVNVASTTEPSDDKSIRNIRSRDAHPSPSPDMTKAREALEQRNLDETTRNALRGVIHKYALRGYTGEIVRDYTQPPEIRAAISALAALEAKHE